MDHQTMLAAHRPAVVPSEIEDETTKPPPAAPLDRQSLLALIKQQLNSFFLRIICQRTFFF